ncbi:hypothetical protein NDU88_003550 [Pleurodeles waltl]|uniref:Uncharacterized protein n=1 Tax=Pleurodeles waltl TaxID=8319 RepID=A0AAV7MS60_PLEWA|nr:hypothetical protein NDU88_003550 [Pleurodeles waltl]
MRGFVKIYIRGQEQRQRARCAQLKAKLLELEGQTGHLDTQAVQHQPALVWSDLQQISLEEAKQCWQASTSRVYGIRDRSSKLLFWLATRGAAARVVPALRDPEGNTQMELEAIAQAYATYYKTYMLETLYRVWQRRALQCGTFRYRLSCLILSRI